MGPLQLRDSLAQGRDFLAISARHWATGSTLAFGVSDPGPHGPWVQIQQITDFSADGQSGLCSLGEPVAVYAHCSVAELLLVLLGCSHGFSLPCWISILHRTQDASMFVKR